MLALRSWPMSAAVAGGTSPARFAERLADAARAGAALLVGAPALPRLDAFPTDARPSERLLAALLAGRRGAEERRDSAGREALGGAPRWIGGSAGDGRGGRETPGEEPAVESRGGRMIGQGAGPRESRRRITFAAPWPGPERTVPPGAPVVTGRPGGRSGAAGSPGAGAVGSAALPSAEGVTAGIARGAAAPGAAARRTQPGATSPEPDAPGTVAAHEAAPAVTSRRTSPGAAMHGAAGPGGAIGEPRPEPRERSWPEPPEHRFSTAELELLADPAAANRAGPAGGVPDGLNRPVAASTPAAQGGRAARAAVQGGARAGRGGDRFDVGAMSVAAGQATPRHRQRAAVARLAGRRPGGTAPPSRTAVRARPPTELGLVNSAEAVRLLGDLLAGGSAARPRPAALPQLIALPDLTRHLGETIAPAIPTGLRAIRPPAGTPGDEPAGSAAEPGDGAARADVRRPLLAAASPRDRHRPSTSPPPDHAPPAVLALQPASMARTPWEAIAPDYGPRTESVFNVTVHLVGGPVDDEELAERLARILVEQAQRHGLELH
jgi:hypothetical protein